MANVEVKQGEWTYTLTLDEDEFWTVLVALDNLTFDDGAAARFTEATYLRTPKGGFQPRTYELWRLMSKTADSLNEREA